MYIRYCYIIIKFYVNLNTFTNAELVVIALGYILRRNKQDINKKEILYNPFKKKNQRFNINC